MIAHSNTTTEELVYYLRNIAVKANAKPGLIDALDRLVSSEDLQRELEETGGKLYDLQGRFNEVRDTLAELCTAIEHYQDRAGYDIRASRKEVLKAYAEALETLAEFEPEEHP